MDTGNDVSNAAMHKASKDIPKDLLALPAEQPEADGWHDVHAAKDCPW